MSRLATLKSALTEALSSHPEVQVDVSADRVTFTVEPPDRPHRFLSVKDASEPTGEETFVMRWSAYRGADNRDGGTYGGFQFTLDTIRHWIFEGRSWREVPEFDAEWVAASRGIPLKRRE